MYCKEQLGLAKVADPGSITPKASKLYSFSC